jgi:PIN domain nuclease of toxin-antitoxin system
MVLIFYQLFQNTWYIQKTNGSHLLSVISEYLIHTKNKWFSSSISYFRILCKYKKNKWFSSSISYFRILGTYKKQMVLIFYQLFQNTWYIQKTNGSHLLSVISEYLIHTKTNGSHLLSVISEYLIHTKNKWFSSSISYFRILCKYKKQMVLIFYQLFQNTL